MQLDKNPALQTTKSYVIFSAIDASLLFCLNHVMALKILQKFWETAIGKGTRNLPGGQEHRNSASKQEPKQSGGFLLEER